MEKSFGYIITSTNLVTYEPVALYESANEDKTIGWTYNFEAAKRFSTPREAEEYNNPYLDMSFRMYGKNIDKDSLRIQKVEFTMAYVCPYIPKKEE